MIDNEKYNTNSQSVGGLLGDIINKNIAIPEIQRPFVWRSSQVRDLIDSLYKGYPTGYLIEWHSPSAKVKEGVSSVGKKLLIDGQQRVTALMTAIAGEYVVNSKYEKVRIKIAFDPFAALSEEKDVTVSALPNNREDNWDICISLNYLSCERPSGVMFGFLVATDVQPNSYDIYKIPTAKFLRMRMFDETARALGHEPWVGGIPPYHWIGEQITPKLGYTYGNDTLPIGEYYGFFKPEDGRHEYCYLYVPVQENNAMAK